jgi:2',3'-cyclic-nucleotide 2'-phosphodiesterase (5'-nucleotidase family)
MKQFLFSLSLFALLLSCGSEKIATYSAKTYSINDTLKSNKLDSIIKPYKTEMDQKMNKVIGHSNYDLEKYTPESPLGNFVADVVFKSGFKTEVNKKDFVLSKTNTFCMLNFGGLRTTINKGNITIKNIYELMPFDNEIVIVKISPKQVNDLLLYLFEKEGQPISNAIAYINSSKGRLDIGGLPYNFNDDIYVITSDYLANGGDKMTFLKGQPYIKSGVLIRDALIEYVSKVKELPNYKVEGRIQYIR